MKAELRHLLDRLKAENPSFSGLMLFPNGSAQAVFRHNGRAFDSLDALEEWAYPEAVEEKHKS